MMGDGVIDLRSIRAMVEAAGYRGHCEVEILSAEGQHRRRRACRPRPPARPSPIAGRGRDRVASGCERPAPSSSARPISTSSRPAWSACARPMACRATRSTRARPGRLELGLGVAVAAGLVPLRARHRHRRLGPRAGGLNNIVGLKPTLGALSTAGVVPACRTLDCVSVFALTVDDRWRRLAAMAGPRRADPYSRRARSRAWSRPPACGWRLGVRRRASACSSATQAGRGLRGGAAPLAALGGAIVEVDFAPFCEPRACSTKARGSPSAASRSRRCSPRRRRRCIP